MRREHLAIVAPTSIIEIVDNPPLPAAVNAPCESNMRVWFHNVVESVTTVAQGLYITLWYFLQTYRRRTFTERFEYPERPVPVKPRYRGFHRFDLTTCIGCDKCAKA